MRSSVRVGVGMLAALAAAASVVAGRGTVHFS
jgi:hypothetical protein